MTPTPNEQKSIEAAVFRRLVEHLMLRTDVQNIDLMGTAGFCRNCLSDWYREAAEEIGVMIDKEVARGAIYGMPYDTYKAAYQTPATPDQLAAMEESVAKNKAMREAR